MTGVQTCALPIYRTIEELKQADSVTLANKQKGFNRTIEELKLFITEENDVFLIMALIEPLRN